MARKSRKQNNTSAVEDCPMIPAKRCAGIYVRLSVEDNGYRTKDSIQNQIALLKGYIEENAGEFFLSQIYIDNGTTGTNFERKEWNRLLDDVKKGKINCVIVKDFSRIGRNYIEVGNYIEKVFPFLGVRVIAVNENYDSQNQSFQSSMLMNSLTNIVNEYYARDISKKVSQTKRTMQKKGEYASGVLPYGYKKTKDKRFVPDPECAVIVKKIFEWRVQGKGCVVIANYLNEIAVPSPGLYRYMNGNMSFKRSAQVKWKSKHVSGILTNPVYLGHMVQGKTRCSYFEQDGKVRLLPKEDWIIVENTHEALITQEQFDIAAAMAERSRQKHLDTLSAHADIPHLDNPLKDKIYCGQCGRHMLRRSRVEKQRRDYCYYCISPSEKMGAHCKNTHIHEEPLMEALQKIMDQHLKMLGTLGNQWSIKRYSDEENENILMIEKQREKLENAINGLKEKTQELYVDLKEELLSPSEYEYEKACLKEKREICERDLKEIHRKKAVYQEAEAVLQEYRSSILTLKDEEISLDILDKLIEKITVFSPERIEVTFTFTDIFKNWNNELQIGFEEKI